MIIDVSSLSLSPNEVETNHVQNQVLSTLCDPFNLNDTNDTSEHDLFVDLHFALRSLAKSRLTHCKPD